MEVKLLELKELENEKVPNNQFYYLMLVPGDSEKRAKCLKVMKNIGKHNFYYCNPAFQHISLRSNQLYEGRNMRLVYK